MSKSHAKDVQRLPSMDLLKGFEAAARLLSFTRAGEELHLTQSAVSRQMRELEEQLGATLFERRHRALALTEAGQAFYPAAAQALAAMREGVQRVRQVAGVRALMVSSTASFASLWLVPRLTRFAGENPGMDVHVSANARIQDLERDGVDVAIRYCPPAMAGEAAVRLFGEHVFPVASPRLLADTKRPLREPADLCHHVLLAVEDPDGAYPWLSWRSWLELAGVGDLRPAGRLHFTEYDQLLRVARDGYGVALGRSALVRDALRAGELVAPFAAIGHRAADSSRAYHVIIAPRARARPDVQRFVDWLQREAAQDEYAPAVEDADGGQGSKDGARKRKPRP